MTKQSLPLLPAYRAMLRHFGPQYWWPGRTRLEVCVGAVLTQNTSWTNVEKAIRQLRRHRALSIPALQRVAAPTLAEWLRPVGYFNVKARRLKHFAAMVTDQFNGSLHRLFALETPDLRAALLATNGIGPETADCILLYAAERPVFVVDAYTRRVLARHGWLAAEACYDEASAIFMQGLPQDTQLYNEYHALLVALGKEFCRPRPRCEGCPLQRWLPRSRPQR